MADNTGCLAGNTAVSTSKLLFLSTDNIAMFFSGKAALVDGLDGRDCSIDDTELLDEETIFDGNIM